MALENLIPGPALAVLHETDELTLQHMCELTRIPAPSGQEAARGQWLADRLRELDLYPESDDVGNVWAVAPSADQNAPRIVVAAHLDTVFGEETPLSVQRSVERMTGPGISDNARGVAGMLALGRALSAAGWPARAPVVLLGTVGEEGAGDLRGAKRFVAAHGEDMAAFIALDGAGASRIINAGVGSRRLRITFRGPGGHSWSDWGAPNAIHAAARAIAALAQIKPPAQPRTTLSVGRVGGGTSINAIPAEAWFELDLRCEERQPLMRLEAQARDLIEAARRTESQARGSVDCVIDVIGDRPAGRTPEDHELVRSAMAATLAIGGTPELSSSSTDANVAMAAGIPAIAIGAGGNAGGTHTPNEWYENSQGVSGLERALRIVLAAARLNGSG